ncbi:MAG: TolC family protein [bacterium]
MKRLGLKIFVFVIIFTASFSFAQEKELTVNECVEIALQQNPDIIMSEFSFKIAGKNVTTSLANLLPSIDANLSYYHSVRGPSSRLMIDPRTGIPVPVQPNEIKSWSSNVDLSVNETIFNGGYNIYNIKRAIAAKKSSKYNLKLTKQNTILVVKERYYNLLKAEKLLEVAEETLKSSEESYKRAQVLFEVGKAPKSDVLKAKVQLENDRLSLITAQNDLSVARASLNHVLGFDVNKKIKGIEKLDIPEYSIEYEDVVNNASQYHPSLLKNEFDLKVSGASVGMAVSSFLPSIRAYYSYSWSNSNLNEINSIWDTDYRWYLGVGLSMPIFQGLSRVAEVSKAKLNRLSQNKKLEQVKRNVALEAQQSYFYLKQAKKKISVTRETVESAEEDLRLNKEKYRLGSGTMLDLLNAQVSYSQAKSDYIQSLYDYKYAIARVEKAMGVLVQ